jgi:hypothetical protein
MRRCGACPESLQTRLDVASNASCVIPALVTSISLALCKIGLLRQAGGAAAAADRLRMAAALPVKSGVQAVPALRDLGVVPTDIALGTACSSREQVLQFVQALEDSDIPDECQVPEVEALCVAHPADAISHVEHIRRCTLYVVGCHDCMACWLPCSRRRTLLHKCVAYLCHANVASALALQGRT